MPCIGITTTSTQLVKLNKLKGQIGADSLEEVWAVPLSLTEGMAKEVSKGREITSINLDPVEIRELVNPYIKHLKQRTYYMNNAYDLPPIEVLDKVISRGSRNFYEVYTYGNVSLQKVELIFKLLEHVYLITQDGVSTEVLDNTYQVDQGCDIMSTKSLIKRFRKHYPHIRITWSYHDNGGYIFYLVSKEDLLHE